MNSERIPTLSPCEWDFRSLPESEARIACYYEYARESATIGAVFSSTRVDEDDLTLSHPILHSFFREFGSSAFSKPWQELPKEDRQYYCGPADTMRVAFGKCDPRTNPGPETFGNTGREHFVAWIDWKASDKDLKREFATFLKESRPALFPSRVNTQKAGAWKTRLDWLGMMRLLHHFKPSELETHCRPAWQRYGRGGRMTSKLSEGRESAERTFHELFGADLRAGEKPRSWSTRGGRGK